MTGPTPLPRHVPATSLAPSPVAFAPHAARFDWEAVFSSTPAPADADAGPSRRKLTAAEWRTVDRLNTAINGRRRDERNVRLDCVGYVQTKRAALIAAGIPEEALSAAIVMTPGGVSHTVLLLSTDTGDVVLDNLSPEIVSWRDTDYVWIEREVPGGGAGPDRRWAWITSPAAAQTIRTASR